MMSVIDQIIEAQKPDTATYEGCRLNAYADPITNSSPWTIGRGHTGPEVYPGVTWTQEKADAVFDNDLRTVAAELQHRLPWWTSIGIPRAGVLLDMAFNMGVGELLQFRITLACIHEGKFTAAAADMLASRWATQVGHRAQRLAAQMRTGTHAPTGAPA